MSEETAQEKENTRGNIGGRDRASRQTGEQTDNRRSFMVSQMAEGIPLNKGLQHECWRWVNPFRTTLKNPTIFIPKGPDGAHFTAHVFVNGELKIAFPVLVGVNKGADVGNLIGVIEPFSIVSIELQADVDCGISMMNISFLAVMV